MFIVTVFADNDEGDFSLSPIVVYGPFATADEAYDYFERKREQLKEENAPYYISFNIEELTKPE